MMRFARALSQVFLRRASSPGIPLLTVIPDPLATSAPGRLSRFPVSP
jgi:hypothetical protein